MDVNEVRPGDRVVFVHRSQPACEDNHRIGTVRSIISLPHKLFELRLDGPDNRFIMAFAEELELAPGQLKPKRRDLGKLYAEMRKDLDQLVESTGGDLGTIAAWLVDRGWDKKL